MTDADRIERLEAEVAELKAQVSFLFRQYGFTDEDVQEFRHRTTVPSPPPGVTEEGGGPVFSEPSG